MPEVLLDTSFLIDAVPEPLEPFAEGSATISALTLAELAAGPSAAVSSEERKVRQQRLRKAELAFDPIPFDDQVARGFGQLSALVRAAGRNPRGRTVDLMIAATAAVHGIPLITRNAKDLVGTESMVEIISVD